jgi:hypothetical protein
MGVKARDLLDHLVLLIICRPSVPPDLAFNNHIPPGVHMLVRIPEGNYQLLHQTIQRKGWN